LLDKAVRAPGKWLVISVEWCDKKIDGCRFFANALLVKKVNNGV